ncbi:MAG: chromosomal replication initiator protein DnaA [Ignavibacteria bacterium]|nr:chromosomal replication initiator protein DnaA [Ignavibacteria bacterium]
MITLDSSYSTQTLTPERVWMNCLKVIKESVSPMAYSTWFLPIKPVGHLNNVLKVELPGNFHWEWIEEHYKSLITKALKSAAGAEAKLEYVVVNDFEHETEKPKNQQSVTLQEKTAIPLVRPGERIKNTLNPKYTFDNFIKGEGNQLARAAAGAISDNPGGTAFNPFFVYGGVGLGKTHLIQAIGNEILAKMPNKKVIYLSSDQFTVEFLDSIQNNKANEFSAYYRAMDVLILDDIQFLIHKEKTQEYFFNIFNTLHQSGKQIILSSDKAPKDLKGMDERLISRFHWGLQADIQPPDYETRMAILSKKANDFGIAISSEILEYIASNITSNIRELEGCLIKLLANVSLNSKEITLDLVKKSVKEISTSKKINIGIDIITKIVCEFLSVEENKVRAKTRKQEVVLARQLSMYLSKELTKSSLKTIGLHFGGRDHSTVIHACTTIDKLLQSEKSFNETVVSIKNKIETVCS